MSLCRNAGLLVVLAISHPGNHSSRADDWPMVRRDAAHSGQSSENIRGPYRVAWARSFNDDPVATAVEPIVADGRAFVGTQAGHLWALDARTGETLWRADGDGPILHATAYSQGTVIFGTAGGHLIAVNAEDAGERWRFRSGRGGFAAAPIVADGRVLIGGRDGRFYALDAADGRLAWTVETGGPIRSTAAVAGDRVLFASDDMHAYAADLRSGRLLWKSARLPGQSLRDYYPVVLDDVAVFRTNPAVSMPQRIGRDRDILVQAAGVEAPTWQELDAWLKGPGPRGSPQQFEVEQKAILDYLEREPTAQTFFALDVTTGRESRRFPMLWASGCQGVGIPPVQTERGPVVFWRTMYSNWNLGVAPLVGLGLLDMEQGRVRPMFHRHGTQPPWNTFWGTADEAQNFSSAGDTLLIAHQGTLSGFDLKTNQLQHIAGTRDSWGGYPSIPGVRNEWHGPARSAAAIADGRLYWLSGSRLIAIESGAAEPSAEPPVARAVSDQRRPPVTPAVPDRDELRKLLVEKVTAYLDGAPWAPLYVEPGIGGREFFFDHSSDVFRALATAGPHLPHDLKERVARHLADLWESAPPYSSRGAAAADQGRRRELFDVPPQRLNRDDRADQVFGRLDAVARYAEQVAGWEIVAEPGVWNELREVFEAINPDDVSDAERNRALADLLAFEEMADRSGHADAAAEAARRASNVRAEIVEAFRRGAESPAAESIAGVARIDELIGRGDAVWTRLGPHKSKITLFLGLSPRAAASILPEVTEAAGAYLDVIESTMPTWWPAWGERSVHYGENFVDYPDNVMGIFAAHALLGESDRRRAVAAFLDIPWCAGDLFFIEKSALALDEFEKSAGGD